MSIRIGASDWKVSEESGTGVLEFQEQKLQSLKLEWIARCKAFPRNIPISPNGQAGTQSLISHNSQTKTNTVPRVRESLRPHPRLLFHSIVQ